MKDESIEEAEVLHETSIARPDDLLPNTLFLLPVVPRPFFPGQAAPLLMDEQHWSDTLKLVVHGEQPVLGLVLVHSESAEQASAKDFARMGTVCRVHRVQPRDGHLQVLVECLQRFRINRFVSSSAPFSAQVTYLPEQKRTHHDEHLKAYAMAIINTIKELLPLNPLYAEELRIFLDRLGPEDPSYLADFAAGLTTSSKDELQEILETVELLPRMEKVLDLLHKELQLAKAQDKIRQTVEQRMNKQQREFFLREQLKVIQQELGIAKDDRTAELDRFKQRLEPLLLTEEAQKRINEEMEKLAILEKGSPEYAVTRNYLDWLTLLPWGVLSADNLNLKHGRRTLEQAHYGLEEIKKRILEFLAVGIMKGSIAGSIILLVGPPGVGKTSLGKSIADALKRKFFRFSVGGIRDEAEIKGHRRTYIGAMPGKFIQAMKEAGTQNPVIMLDEIDKIGASYQGDPASALLEVLDPEQNSDFLDHYLDVRFDLSKTLFICTANQLDTIPAPLLDRMETIQLSSYLSREKREIAQKYLLPRQLHRAGLTKDQLKIGSKTLDLMIEEYARDAGVRRLEKHLGTIARKAVVRILDGAETPIKVTAEQLREYLGPPLFRDERNLHGIGIVTGLAWTSMGGATLSIEAIRVHENNRGLKLTGQLGDVMKESVEIAYSFVQSNAALFGADPAFFEKAFIHLHIPAGATPKDGPSAGITMATALLSLARNQPVSRRVAMTGELTLTGQVFPVGGIREKVLAARRAGIQKVLLPSDNRGDFDEIPGHIRTGIEAHFISNYQEAARLLFRDK